MLHISDDDVGGARVRRIFTAAGRALRAGDMLTRDEVLAMRNRRTLAEISAIEIWPRATGIADAERHIVHNGGGRFDVIAGHKLNERPLTKDEAEELATRPN